MIKFENELNGRYYYLLMEKDFFNDFVLTIIRGGKYSRVVRHYGYNCLSDIIREIKKITLIRIKRGYRVIE